MALQQRIEWREADTPATGGYADDPLPPLVLRELEELHRREQSLPQRSSAKARRLFLTAIIGGATLWGLLIEGVNLALKTIA